MKPKFDNAFVLNVVADDHPGIVAAVGTAVISLGGNIDSCSQTVLRGYFTLIMIVSMPESVSADALADAVRERGTGLQVIARPYEPTGMDKAQYQDRFVVTAFGKDKPGVILRFTQYLAGKDINIVDLYGDRSGDEFVLISEVEIPSRWEIPMLQADLEEIGRDEGFTVRLQHENIFVATNELRMSRKAGREV